MAHNRLEPVPYQVHPGAAEGGNGCIVQPLTLWTVGPRVCFLAALPAWTRRACRPP